jgi:hypothetical protein
MIRIVKCDICFKQKKENIMLLGKNICKECEIGLIESNADDPHYPVYLDKMKDIVKLAIDNYTAKW